jgi:hypothetical protein
MYIYTYTYKHIPDSFVSREILSQAKSILSRLAYSGWRLSYIPGVCSINCTKTKLAASSTFRAVIDARYRIADIRKPRGNGIVRRLACSVAWKLSVSVSPQVVLPFLQFALLHSVKCVQLRLITVLGNRGCVAVARFLDVLSALMSYQLLVTEHRKGWE